MPRRLFTLAAAFGAALAITSPASAASPGSGLPGFAASTASAASPAGNAGPIHLRSGGWYTCQHDMHANVANEMDVRNNGGQPMCIGSHNWADDFTVYHSSVTRSWADFPNIYSGCEMDGSLPQLCTSGHATPVRVSSIRTDTSSVSYYYPQRGFEGNAAYDIWFNKSGGHPQGFDNGAEIMVWLGSHGIGSPVYTRKVEVDGIWWGYMTWNAGQPGHTWHYIRYWRLSGWTPHSAATLNLLSFFKDAERTGRLSSSWYLTGTEYGFEVCYGGRGLQVKNFTDRITAR
jgi:glycosyl hydrolase family 12